MICVAGRCIKCPALIMEGHGPSNKYQEIVCQMSDGSLMAIGICCDCSIGREEFPELTRAVREAFGLQGFRMNSDVVDIIQRKSLSDVLKEIQVNRCSICLQPIGDNFAITHGRLIHDVCEGARGNLSETLADIEIGQRTARARPKHLTENKYGKRI